MDTFRKDTTISLRHSKHIGEEAMASSSSGQIMSDLLTLREKKILLNLLEPDCKLIKTTVAQILQAKETEGEKPSWHRLDCGVLCLTEKVSVNSYFLRLYCITRSKLQWEQELYVPLKYNAICAYFHTFPAESHYVGINFANKAEAEEFHLAVENVHEKMTTMIHAMKKEVKKPSISPSNLVKALDENPHEEPASPAPTLNTNTVRLLTHRSEKHTGAKKFSDLDPALSSLLMKVKLSKEDIKNKDVSEVVDYIISHVGGLKAVQTELKINGAMSKTLPRTAGASFPAALLKGPLPPVPLSQSSTNSQHSPQHSAAQNTSQFLSSLPTSLPTSPTTGRVRRSASYVEVGSPASAQGGDVFLAALREVFKQKKMFKQNTSESLDEADAQSNSK